MNLPNTTLRNLQNTTLRLALLACISATGLTSCHAQKAASTTSQKIAALQGLRDSGVISEDEYEQKVSALKGGTPAAASSPSANAPVAPLVAHTLVDQAWGLPAATVRIPRGWGFAGGVLHAAGGACTVTGTSAVMNIETPDGTEGLVAMPALRAQYVSDPQSMRQYASSGCLVAKGMTAQDFLKNIVIPKARPGARILDSGPDPLLEASVAQIKQSMAGLRVPPVVTSARVRISYTRYGHAVEEFVSAVTSCSRMQIPGTPGFSVDCTADQINLVHAPAGQLDALAATKELIDLKPNPAWQARLQQDNQNFQQASQEHMLREQDRNAANASAYLQNNKNQMAATAAQGQQNVDTIHNIGEASMKIDRERQGAIDHAAQGTALSVSNSNIYTDPNTGKQVQLSDQYGHTYVNAEGTMVQQTNSASGPIGGGWWTEMTPNY